MTVHPFRPRAGDPDTSSPRAPDDLDDGFPFDFHEAFAQFDDADESMHRYGSVDPQYRYAHRTLSAAVLLPLGDPAPILPPESV